MIKHQATRESVKRNCFKMGWNNLPFVPRTNSTKRTLVKDLHFIGPQLSHLINLTVTEWRPRDGGGDREIGRCQTCVTLKCTFHSRLPRPLSQIVGKKEKEVTASKAADPLTLTNITAVKNHLRMTDVAAIWEQHLPETPWTLMMAMKPQMSKWRLPVWNLEWTH